MRLFLGDGCEVIDFFSVLLVSKRRVIAYRLARLSWPGTQGCKGHAGGEWDCQRACCHIQKDPLHEIHVVPTHVPLCLSSSTKTLRSQNFAFENFWVPKTLDTKSLRPQSFAFKKFWGPSRGAADNWQQEDRATQFYSWCKIVEGCAEEKKIYTQAQC